MNSLKEINCIHSFIDSIDHINGNHVLQEIVFYKESLDMSSISYE